MSYLLYLVVCMIYIWLCKKLGVVDTSETTLIVIAILTTAEVISLRCKKFRILIKDIEMPKGVTADRPLVSVPPHGRLIDADALLNLLDNCMFPSDMITTTAVRMAENWIKEAPTVIGAEEGET